MIELDLNDFTLGEIEEIEQVADIAFSDLFKSKKSGLAMAACLWVSRRRADPGFTLDDAKREKLRDISIVAGDADPTVGGD